MTQYKWILTAKDFENARILYEKEKIFPINKENMFRAGIYCILSAAEKYQKHKSIYNELIENKIDTPENIKKNREKLISIVRKARFPNQKSERIYKFALWWLESDLPGKIIEDVNNNRENEFELRNRFAEEAPGIWYKGASLFMIKCGYENVVPVDLWMLRFLKHNGYDVELPDYRKKSGPKPKEYLEYENILREMAQSYDVSPAIFQFALWSKFSTWNNKKK